MNELIALTGMFGFAFITAFCLFIFVMSILMPLFVWGIYNRTRALERTASKLSEQVFAFHTDINKKYREKVYNEIPKR